MNKELENILNKVKNGELSVEDAILQLKVEPFSELGYAKVDHHRKIRQGVAEVIYGEGKKAEKINGIVTSMKDSGQNLILITRLEEEKANLVKQVHEMNYYADAQIGVIGKLPIPDGNGKIVIATGGTSDFKVAQEAAITAKALGNEVIRLYDVGVAGIHRLLSHIEDIMSANVIVCVAGMEGALPSVVGGLADCPVIAVPTSVGYGTSFGGVTALLGMLNSCASGVSVVNIDNGFGAGYLASVINHQKCKS